MIPRNNNETDEDEPPTEINELNEIAADWSASEGLPDDVQRERVEEVCHTLADKVEETIDGLESRTTFTDLEARAWALDHVVDENHEPLTDDAIAIFLSIEGGAKSWLARESVGELIHSARDKYEDAKEMVGEVTFPQREEQLESPEIVWLDSRTVADIEYLAAEEETIHDDVVSRWANAVKTVLGVREFVEKYLEARGKDSVAQLTVAPEFLPEGVLPFVSYTGMAGKSLPQVVRETDSVEVAGQQFDFIFEESPYGPEDGDELSLFVNESIEGMDAVNPETGVADLEADVIGTTIHIEKLVDIAKNRMDAYLVSVSENNDELLFTVTKPMTDNQPINLFKDIQNVKIDGQVYPATVQQREWVEYPTSTLVWSTGTFDDLEEVSLEEGIESLQSLITEGVQG